MKKIMRDLLQSFLLAVTAYSIVATGWAADESQSDGAE